MSRNYTIASESSVIVYFGSTIDPLISQEVQKAYQALKAEAYEGFYEIIPSYASLMVSYDLMRFDFDAVCEIIETCIHHAEAITMAEPKIVTIPVYYGLEVGLDLELLCEEKKPQCGRNYCFAYERALQCLCNRFCSGVRLSGRN